MECLLLFFFIVYVFLSLCFDSRSVSLLARSLSRCFPSSAVSLRLPCSVCPAPSRSLVHSFPLACIHTVRLDRPSLFSHWAFHSFSNVHFIRFKCEFLCSYTRLALFLNTSHTHTRAHTLQHLAKREREKEKRDKNTERYTR